MVQLCKKNCLEISFRETMKSQRGQKSSKMSTEFKLVLQETTRSTAKDSQQADAEKAENISNATGHQSDHPVRGH